MKLNIDFTIKRKDMDKKKWQINRKNNYYGYAIQNKGILIRFRPKISFKTNFKEG